MRSLTTISNDRDFTATFTAEYDTDNSVAIITPSTGRQLVITGVYVSSEAATTIGQKIRLSFNTSVNTVLSLFPSAVANTSSSLEADSLLVKGAVNEPLTLTSNLGNGKNFYIAINYREE